ncbi:hypothetical protein CAPTEDRAFT_84266, partial [Capitella teleta]
CPKLCECYNDYSTVDCSSKGIADIPPLSILTQHLSMDANDIVSLPIDAFAAVPNLIKLHIRNTKLTSINTNSFCGLQKLQELHLGHNEISEFLIGQRADCKLPNLKNLLLSGNKLSEPPRNLSFVAPNLEILILHNNDLESLALDESYNQMRSLENLDVSLNRIHEITRNDLDPLRDNLESLFLQSNHLSKLENVVALPRLRRLHELDLSFNFIRSLPSGQFRALHHLSTLDLQGNYIHDLAMVSLGGLPSLAKLVVSNNQLSSVQTEVISQLEFLEVLDASSNPYECTCNLQPFLDWLSRTR